MSAISCDQERELITALGRPMAMMILAQLCAGIAQHMAQPTVNNTLPIYAATNDYDEAIDGVLGQQSTPYYPSCTGIL